MTIYLDYAATTPVDAGILAEMHPYFSEVFANPASLHEPGQKARRAIEDARDRVAAALHASAPEVIFTSGATEAINHGLKMAAALRPHGHIVTSQLEHSAVLHTVRGLERQGHAVTYLEPDATGAVDSERLKSALRSDTALVALMLVNNETGVITDVAGAAAAAKEVGAIFFCDAVQAFGTLPVDMRELGADLLTVSGHKVYGPKGVGVLVARRGLDLPPLLTGGEQERGRRAGTVNVPAAVGMGAAAQLAAERLDEDARRLLALRDEFEAQVTELPSVHVNGARAPRGPKHVNVSVSGVDGEALLIALDRKGVHASAGSACAAGTLEPSHVLRAMGLPREAAKASVRFSLGRDITAEALRQAAERFKRVVSQLREQAS